jgi:hypothetical protein
MFLLHCHADDEHVLILVRYNHLPCIAADCCWWWSFCWCHDPSTDAVILLLMLWSCWWCYDTNCCCSVECVVMWLNVLWCCTGKLKTWTQCCCFDTADDAYFLTDVKWCFLLVEAIILDPKKIFHQILLFISVQFALEFSWSWCWLGLGQAWIKHNPMVVVDGSWGLGQATGFKSNTKWAKPS